MKVLPIELHFSALRWAQSQILECTQWGLILMDKFEEGKVNLEACDKDFFVYLEYLKDPMVLGTEFDVLLLCEC